MHDRYRNQVSRQWPRRGYGPLATVTNDLDSGVVRSAIFAARAAAGASARISAHKSAPAFTTWRGLPNGRPGGSAGAITGGRGGWLASGRPRIAAPIPARAPPLRSGTSGRRPRPRRPADARIRVSPACNRGRSRPPEPRPVTVSSSDPRPFPAAPAYRGSRTKRAPGSPDQVMTLRGPAVMPPGSRSVRSRWPP
jgi:hypothetical protein